MYIIHNVFRTKWASPLQLHNPSIFEGPDNFFVPDAICQRQMISLRICAQPAEHFYFIGKVVELSYETKTERYIPSKCTVLFFLNL